eukprot:4325218-Amphidinium_carterae.1
MLVACGRRHVGHLDAGPHARRMRACTVDAAPTSSIKGRRLSYDTALRVDRTSGLMCPKRRTGLGTGTALKPKGPQNSPKRKDPSMTLFANSN